MQEIKIVPGYVYADKSGDNEALLHGLVKRDGDWYVEYSMLKGASLEVKHPNSWVSKKEFAAWAYRNIGRPHVSSFSETYRRSTTQQQRNNKTENIMSELLDTILVLDAKEQDLSRQRRLLEKEKVAWRRSAEKDCGLSGGQVAGFTVMRGGPYTTTRVVIEGDMPGGAAVVLLNALGEGSYVEGDPDGIAFVVVHTLPDA